MKSAELLLDAFSRIRDAVHEAVEGLSDAELTERIDPDANTVAWLIWHLSRIQDDHIADAFGTEQVWTSEGFSGRFGLPFPEDATGYGHTSAQVAAVRAPADLLLDYYDTVHARTVEHVTSLTDADLDRVVDTRWTPHVTLGVRIVSVITDDNQHVGQAAYVRGVVERAGGAG
ncbi:mycothiol transferase [Streptomyces sp. NPDC004788]